ncbi:MAG: hypothetical protein NT003_03275 [Candidatus Magasanikbacteria bacterium]|nr:hypothetical protein [Candidatus Magasanikbacteria bacterium]
MPSNILLVQFRTDQSLPHEQKCVSLAIGEEAPRLKFMSAIVDEFPPEVLSDVGAVIFGGSGEFFLSEGAGENSWLPKIFAFIDEIYARDIPVFGICFGHQVMLLKEGSVIRRAPELKELGVLPITLTDAAAADPIFGVLPEKTFETILAHQDTPVDLPSHIQILGSTERVVAGAVRIGDRRAWSVMFHPDMDRATNTERVAMFPHYAEDPEKLAELIASFRDAPIAQSVLKNFALFTK